jgi:hypothetical protein
MINFSKVVDEIKAVMQQVQDEVGRPDVLLITQRVLQNHPSISGPDRDFYICCAYRAVRHEVRERANQFPSGPRVHPSQITLEGFEHLQSFYQVSRPNGIATVAIDEMTDDELEEKAREYEAMGRACMEHADELRRYRDLRGGPDLQPRPSGPRPELNG